MHRFRKDFHMKGEGRKAYLTVTIGNRKIMTEVTVLKENGQDNKAVITTDYKRVAKVDKWLLMDKENYDRELQNANREKNLVDSIYSNLIYKNNIQQFKGERL